jgi:NADH dehydrogenase [ubiquinone] 1 alpha subcomplex assembly factor 7
MSDAVHDAVVAAIRGGGGDLSFADYMELALYGPEGYYERPPIGPHGDFVTSPHVHPIFGRLVARAIRGCWDALDHPVPLRITEVGAGDGTLAGQIIEELADLPLRYAAVERSSGARAVLERIGGLEAPLTPPADAHVVVANELLDNLAFRRVQMTEHGPCEVRVTEVAGQLVERLVPASRELARAAGSLHPGEETVVPDGALAFVDDLPGLMAPAGYGLLIDYGAVRGTGGPAHGYRAHALVEDPLDAPGDADITAGVDFSRIADRAEGAGMRALPSVTQRSALAALGFEAWIRGEIERQQGLLETREGAEAVRAWSERSRATLLVDPGGLGRFRWLLLATQGRPSPSWLDDALRRDTPGRHRAGSA